MPYTETAEDLVFDFNDVLNRNEVRFDTKQLRDRTSMQPVDFIAEYEDCYRFIEVKDPDQLGARNPQAYEREFREGKGVRDLAGKFRDSFFLFSLQGREPKRVEYVVLLSMARLEAAFLVTKTDELRKSIPWKHRSMVNSPLTTCVILNLAQWQNQFGQNSVWRASDYS